jgi:hypothetical protein
VFTPDPDKLAAELVAAGASPAVADAILSALLEAGLSPVETRDWLDHPNRAYPHDWPMDMLGQVIDMKAGSRWLIEQGKAEMVLTGAREFAAADGDERRIARLFGGNIGDARRLTGGVPERAAVIAAIATTIYECVEVPENVCYVGQTRLPQHDGRRIVDRLLDGEENAVRDELASGKLDPRALLESDDLMFVGW